MRAATREREGHGQHRTPKRLARIVASWFLIGWEWTACELGWNKAMQDRLKNQTAPAECTTRE